MNLTITIDEDILRRARIRALEQGTSVNALVADMLTRYARERDEQAGALASLASLASSLTDADRANARARGGRAWARDDLHAR